MALDRATKEYLDNEFAKLHKLHKDIHDLLVVGKPEENLPSVLERIRYLEWTKNVLLGAVGILGTTTLGLLAAKAWEVITKTTAPS